MTENKLTHRHVDDGKQDLFIKINGHTLVHMPEDGYKSLGITYEQATEFLKTFSQLIFALATSTTCEEHSKEGEK